MMEPKEIFKLADEKYKVFKDVELPSQEDAFKRGFMIGMIYAIENNLSMDKEVK